MKGKTIMLHLLTIALATTFTKAGEADSRILVLGGNGFMGADTVERLLNKGYNVTMLNRGRWYWDAKERIFPKVQSISCDRDEGLLRCRELHQLLKDTPDTFKAVIDFSAYKPGQVKESAAMLKQKTDVYILISSDTVYDVSAVKDGSELYKESDAVRPEDEKEREHYEKNSRGHNKLVSEEELVQSGANYVILRLPDVIGPRDSSHRWWIYQMWMKLSSKLKENQVRIPEFFENYSMSMVYSQDVAQTIENLIKDDDVRNQVFNLAWPEKLTLKDILENLRHELRLGSDVKIEVWKPEDRQFHLYPSGRRGPMDVQKAVDVLGWSPTPWRQAFRDTVAFYENAMRDEKFKTQMDEVIQMVENEVMREENKTVMYKTLEELYGIDLKHFVNGHEEL